MAAVAAKYEWLPVTFRNVVVEYREIGNGFEATIRSSAATKEELTQWLQYFEDKTNTRWGVRRTHPDVQRLAFRLISSASTATSIRVMRGSVRQRIATVEPS